MKFGQKTAKQTIEQVASNDKSLEALDITKSASFCMKSLDNTVALAEALKSNTVIKSVVLRECEIVDAGAEALGEALASNNTIEELDLQQNKLTTNGAIAIAKGLAKNRGVKTLNLMNQSQKVLGEDALEMFISIFETNLTLTKLMWKVDSRRTWELSKLITRNVEIGRRLASGAAVEDLLPTKLRGTDVSALISAVPTPVAKQAPAAAGYTSAPAPAAPVAKTTPPPAETPVQEQTTPAEDKVTPSEAPVPAKEVPEPASPDKADQGDEPSVPLSPPPAEAPPPPPAEDAAEPAEGADASGTS